MKSEIKTPTRIAANESQIDAKCISSGCKDSHYFKIDYRQEKVKNVDLVLNDVFSRHIMTMKQASVTTRIDRSTICWFVGRLRKGDKIWRCGKGVDPVTGESATYLTTNRGLAVEFYKDETKHLWRDLPEEKQMIIFRAIDAYLERKNFGIFISSFIERDETREVWLRVQEYIDGRMSERPS